MMAQAVAPQAAANIPPSANPNYQIMMQGNEKFAPSSQFQMPLPKMDNTGITPSSFATARGGAGNVPL